MTPVHQRGASDADSASAETRFQGQKVITKWHLPGSPPKSGNRSSICPAPGFSRHPLSRAPARGACPRLLWLNGTGKTTVSVVKSRQFNSRASRDVHLKTMQPADPELASSWCSGLLVRGVSADRHSGPRRPCLRELIRIVAGPACSVRFERGFSCCRVSAGWEHLFRAWNLEILFRACSRW